VLSAQQGWGAKQGGNLAMRPLTAQATADQIVTFPGRNIKAFDHCLTPHGFNVQEGNQVTWWPCQSDSTQKLSQEWLRSFIGRQTGKSSTRRSSKLLKKAGKKFGKKGGNGG